MNAERDPMNGSLYNELRLAEELTDAVIIAEEVKFPVHKIILCTFTPYFCELFTDDSRLDQNVFPIPGISADIMGVLLDYAYTCSLAITGSNALELLLAANLLCASEVVEACCRFIEALVTPDNCIGVWRFTTTVCPQPVLHHNVHCYILQHFQEVAWSNGFLLLSARELYGFIRTDSLIVQQESQVYEAVLRWINHAPQERRPHFRALFSKVRLALLDFEYVRANVLSHFLVIGQCRRRIFEASRINHQLLSIGSYLPGVRNSLARPRLPTAILLAIGGWSGSGPTNGVEAYDVRADCWINVTSSSGPTCAYHGAVFLNGYVYCVGGFDKVEYFNSVQRFDPITGDWQEVGPMYHQRCYVSVTVLNGCIYAMGGYDGHTRLKAAECYWPETNQWTLIAPMHKTRSDASCTTLNNKIYICGGFNGEDCLQTAECYSPNTDQWTMIAPLNHPRSGLGVVAYAGRVYAVGGFNGHRRLRLAEAYDPETNVWTDVASMFTARSNFGIEVLEDQMYVVGGFNGFTTTYEVERYNAAAGEWTQVRSMEIFRSALSCCVISGLPNMAEYVVPRDNLPLLSIEGETRSEDSS